MKILFKFLAVLTVLAFSFVPSLVRAQDDASDDQGTSFQNFYDQLGSQGNWVQTDDYGYVFQPNVSDPNWAPYTDGHWVYTDMGWTWVSDEPWGWATYHYGRWANIDGTGWVWVPGYQWAPAWVSWRYGGGYCGWAPLPPDTFFGAEYGQPGFDAWATFHFGGDVDIGFNIGPGCYNFISVGDMGESNYRGHFLDRSRNYAVINKTTNVTNININRNGATGAGGNFRGVAVGGPPINEVNAHARQRIQTVSLAAANQPGKSTLQGNSLAIYAPKINPASIHQARPTTVSQTIAHPTLNRGDSITKPLAVNARLKPSVPTPEAIQAAQAAQLHTPAKAKIATDNTTVRTPLTTPLTSLQPVHRTTSTGTSGANGFNGEKTVNPNTEHTTANAPFTGESVKPATTYHPENEAPPKTEVKPTTTYPPENEGEPKTESKPAPSFHSENPGQPKPEVKPENHPQSPPPNKPSGGNGNKNGGDDKNKQQGQ